jgi:Rap1a immunity proteins
VIASAFASGVSWGADAAGNRAYCASPDLKGGQIMSAFEQFLRDNPKMADEPYGAAMAGTLSKAFPCGAQRRSKGTQPRATRMITSLIALARAANRPKPVEDIAVEGDQIAAFAVRASLSPRKDASRWAAAPWPRNQVRLFNRIRRRVRMSACPTCGRSSPRQCSNPSPGNRCSPH